MGLYKNTNGVLTPIAGRGKAEYGASTVRTGNVAVNIAGGGTNPMEVTFDTPMPDANYMVDCTITDQQLSKQIITVEKKTANGFILYVTNVYTNALSYNIKYTAFKLYTDNEYNGLLNNQRYSTDEIDTGKTWIDGKKIYRRVIETTSPTAANTDVAIYTFNGVDSFINISGYIINTSYTTFNQFMPLNWARSGGIDTYVTISNDNIKTLSIKQYCANSGYINKPETIIIEYTKIT